MKIKIIRWLVGLLNDEYLLVRRERIKAIALMVNEYPGTRIPVLSLIRLDGSDLKSALAVYNEWNDIKD